MKFDKGFRYLLDLISYAHNLKQRGVRTDVRFAPNSGTKGDVAGGR
jgi:hypothetical protein